jgi:hypothetical protein
MQRCTEEVSGSIRDDAFFGDEKEQAAGLELDP